MTEKELIRRRALVATLFFWAMASVLKLREEMERVHGIVCSCDLIRADLAWLEEMGFIRLARDSAQLTERGRDVATMRAMFPGEV